MLRPEVEYWSTPNAYLRRLDRQQQPNWLQKLAAAQKVLLAAAFAPRVARTKPVKPPRGGHIPGYIRDDLGLPPESGVSWHWDPHHGVLPGKHAGDRL